MRKINGKVPSEVKAQVWRELAGFDPLADNTFDCEGTIEKIALVYGLDATVVEAELALSEVLPVFLDCVAFVNSKVFEKLDKVAKKKENNQK